VSAISFRHCEGRLDKPFQIVLLCHLRLLMDAFELLLNVLAYRVYAVLIFRFFFERFLAIVTRVFVNLFAGCSSKIFSCF